MLLTLGILYLPNALSGGIPVSKKQILDLSEQGYWDIAGEAIYVQPQNLFSGAYELDTFYDWGYTFHIKYQMSDVKSFYIRWLRFRSKMENLSKNLSDFQNEGPTTVDYRYLSRFDILYVELEQKLNFKSNLDVMIHGGFSYSTSQTTKSAQAISNTTQFTEVQAYNISYRGAGAVIGADVLYPLTSNITLLIYNNFLIQTRYAKFRQRKITRDQTSAETSQFDDLLYGAIASAEGFVGIDYKPHILDSGLHARVGWLTILYDQDTFKWSGAFFGARWVGN